MLKSRFNLTAHSVAHAFKSKWIYIIAIMLMAVDGNAQLRGYNWTFTDASNVTFKSGPAVVGSTGVLELNKMGSGSFSATTTSDNVGLGSSCTGPIQVRSFTKPVGLEFLNDVPRLVTNTYTIEMVINLSDDDVYRRLVSFYDLGGSKPAYGIYVSDAGVIDFYTTTSHLLTGATLNANTWYQLVFVRSSNNIVSFYLNGTLVNTYNDSANDFLPHSEDENFNIVTFFKDAGNEESSGKIARIGIFNEPLPLEDIQKRLNNICGHNVPTGSNIVFQPTDEPEEELNNDGNPIEVGVKFRATQSGVIKGIRYYKGAGTTGTHKGHLWTTSGTQLAEAVFLNETASGWQQVLFTTPVAIDANVTYIASCHSSSGDYAASDPYFTQDIVNGPVKALADGADGANGLYIYSPTSALPVSSNNSANYWVDIVFSPGSGGGGGTISGTTNYIAKFTAPTTIGNSILFDNGTSVGIGTININDANYKLFVETGIRTRKVKVDVANWPDYVFDKKHRLPSLYEIETFINKNKHLPGVPSAKEIEEKGLDLGDQQAMLLKKIEEMTLYIISINKELDSLKKETENLKKQIKQTNK